MDHAVHAIEQVAITVIEVAAAEAHYRDVLGLTFLFAAGPQLAFLTDGGSGSCCRRPRRGSGRSQFDSLFRGRFVTRGSSLKVARAMLRKRTRSDAVVWISWPKKSSKVATDVSEDATRAVALTLGLVDVKVCAAIDVWSGLQLAFCKRLR